MIIAQDASNFTSIVNTKTPYKNQNTKEQTTRDFTQNKTQHLSFEQAQAMSAQRVSFKGSESQKIPHITEKDINIAVTCLGHSEIKGNTRNVYDFRCIMNSRYGFDWSKNFTKPHIVHNGNLDEKRNGETTALVIPLHPQSNGLRGQDNMTLLLNGNVSKETLNELVSYMAKSGILNAAPLFGIQYYVNSKEPYAFMSNPKIKPCIANFFKQKEVQQAEEAEAANKNIKTSDINIVNIGRKFDPENQREVKDYLREFLKNNKKMTVVYDQIQKDGYTKDITAILIPSTKSDWDCITVTIDKKIPQETCKNLINHLVRTKSANVEDKNFRSAIIEYLNNLQ